MKTQFKKGDRVKLVKVLTTIVEGNITGKIVETDTYEGHGYFKVEFDEGVKPPTSYTWFSGTELELVKPAMPFKVGDKVRFIYPNRNSKLGIGVVQRIDGLSCRVIFDTEDSSKRYALCYAYELELVEDEDETELLTENHIETFNDYQHAAYRTMNNDLSYTENLANLSMGLAGETGELVDHLKKCLFHGHEYDAEKVKEELGDVLWYLTVLADDLNYDMEDIAIANINKLTKRYPKGFSTEVSKNRKEG